MPAHFTHGYWYYVPLIPVTVEQRAFSGRGPDLQLHRDDVPAIGVHWSPAVSATMQLRPVSHTPAQGSAAEAVSQVQKPGVHAYSKLQSSM